MLVNSLCHVWCLVQLEHPFFMGRSVADPLAPVTREKRVCILPKLYFKTF